MSETSNKPLYVHDCDCCKFLGRFSWAQPGSEKADDYDLYYHGNGKNSDGETVIARFGRDGDYYSGIWSSYTANIVPLVIARIRAVEAGYTKFDLKTALRYAERGSIPFYEAIQALKDHPAWELLTAVMLQDVERIKTCLESYTDEQATEVREVFKLAEIIANYHSVLRENKQISNLMVDFLYGIN